MAKKSNIKLKPKVTVKHKSKSSLGNKLAALSAKLEITAIKPKVGGGNHKFGFLTEKIQTTIKNGKNNN